MIYLRKSIKQPLRKNEILKPGSYKGELAEVIKKRVPPSYWGSLTTGKKERKEEVKKNG